MRNERFIHRVQSAAEFERLRPGIRKLLALYRHILISPATAGGLEGLVQNTAGMRPCLWVIADVNDDKATVWAMAALGDIEAGRHAFLHGVSHPAMRRHPLITSLALHVFRFAFERLGVFKVKAEFETDNAGAKGFCRRFGFVREALYRQDVRIAGQLKDVAVASLSVARFREVATRYEAP